MINIKRSFLDNITLFLNQAPGLGTKHQIILYDIKILPLEGLTNSPVDRPRVRVRVTPNPNPAFSSTFVSAFH